MSDKRLDKARKEQAKQMDATKPAIAPKPSVPKHRQCPACWEGLKGKGKEKWWRRVSGTLVRRCYSCDCCGYNWTVDVRTTMIVESIEYQDINIETREE